MKRLRVDDRSVSVVCSQSDPPTTRRADGALPTLTQYSLNVYKRDSELAGGVGVMSELQYNRCVILARCCERRERIDSTRVVLVFATLGRIHAKATSSFLSYGMHLRQSHCRKLVRLFSECVVYVSERLNLVILCHLSIHPEVLLTSYASSCVVRCPSDPLVSAGVHIARILSAGDRRKRVSTSSRQASHCLHRYDQILPLTSIAVQSDQTP